MGEVLGLIVMWVTGSGVWTGITPVLMATLELSLYFVKSACTVSSLFWTVSSVSWFLVLLVCWLFHE